VDVKQIAVIYEEANFFFPDKVKQHFEAANKFHQSLAKNSRELTQEVLKSSKEELKTLRAKLAAMGVERDKILKTLDAQGALEEYTSILDRINTLSLEIQKLDSHKSSCLRQRPLAI